MAHKLFMSPVCGIRQFHYGILIKATHRMSPKFIVSKKPQLTDVQGMRIGASKIHRKIQELSTSRTNPFALTAWTPICRPEMDRVKASECHNFADVLGVEIVAPESTKKPKRQRGKIKAKSGFILRMCKGLQKDASRDVLANESDTKAMTMTYIAWNPSSTRTCRTPSPHTTLA